MSTISMQKKALEQIHESLALLATDFEMPSIPYANFEENLRKIVAHFSYPILDWHFRPNGRGGFMINWSVWDGKDFHESPDLTAAVTAAILATSKTPLCFVVDTMEPILNGVMENPPHAAVPEF